MAGEILKLADHGKIIQVPASCMAIAFTCGKCQFEFTGRVIEGQIPGKSFGTCPRCKSPGLAKMATLNFDQIRHEVKALLEEQDDGEFWKDTSE